MNAMSKEKRLKLVKDVEGWIRQKGIRQVMYTTARQLLPGRKFAFKLKVGGGSYTDGKKITVGVPEIALDQDKEVLFSIIKALVGHESEHIWSSDFTIFKQFQVDVKKYFEDKFNMGYVAHKLGAHLLNSTEDGRIEKRLINRYEGYKSHIQLLNGTFWEAQPIEGNDELFEFLYSITSMCVTGLKSKDWERHYDGTEADKLLDEVRPLIINAINNPTAKGCADDTMEILEVIAPYVAGKLKEIKDMKDFLNQLRGDAENETSNPQEGQDAQPGKANSSHFIEEEQKKNQKSKEQSDEPGDSQESDSDDGEGSGSSETESKDDSEDSEGKGSSKDDSNDDEENQGEGSDGTKDESGSEDETNDSGEGNSTGDSEDKESDDEGDENSGSGSSDNSEDDSDDDESTGKGESDSEDEETNGSEKEETSKDHSKDEKSTDSEEKSGQSENKPSSSGLTSDEVDELVDSITQSIKEELKEEAEKGIKQGEREVQKEEAKDRKENEYTGHLSEKDWRGIDRNVFFRQVEPSSFRSSFLPQEIKSKGQKLNRDLKRLFMNKQSYTSRNRRKGILDTSALWKTSVKDSNMFVKKGTPNDTDYAVNVICDYSGSMLGEKLDRATEATAMIEEALRDLVPLRISYFTAYQGDVVVHSTVRDFDQQSNDTLSWKRLPSIQSAVNRDGYSIKIATQELLKRKERKKMLIVLSDGLPSAISRRHGQREVQEAVREARQAGVSVITIAFGSEYEIQDNKSVYLEMYQKGLILVQPSEIDKHLFKTIENEIKR